MTTKGQNYAFITPDESEEDTENLSEEIIRSRIRRKDYVEIVRFNDFDPWILWLSSQDTWYKFISWYKL